MSDRFIARCQAILDDPNAPAVKKEEAREQIARLVEEINEANDDVGWPLVGSDQTKKCPLEDVAGVGIFYLTLDYSL
jgi:hypothetical protein